MNKNINLCASAIKLGNKFENINIEINDNKHMINTFEGQFTKFLLRNKGTTFNNKDELLIILNDKPRTFLIRLQLLINNLNLNLKKQHSKNIKNKLNKNYQELQTKIQNRKIDHNIKSQIISASHSADSQSTVNNNSAMHRFQGQFTPWQISSGSLLKASEPVEVNNFIIEKIKTKIKIVENLLIKNNLPIPVNLLKPLLNTTLSKENKNSFNYLDRNIIANLANKNSIKELETKKKNLKTVQLELPDFNKILYLGKTQSNIKNYLFETIQNHKKGIEKLHPLELDFIQSLINQLDNEPTVPNQNLSSASLINNIKNTDSSTITLLKNKIKNYTDNNIDILNMNTTQYFELVTPQKKVNSFTKNIVYNFNKYNNTNFINIFTLLEYAFKSMSCLISKPQYVETPQKLVIQLFYFLIPVKFSLGPFGNKKNKYNKNLNSLPIATEVDGIKIPSNNNINKNNKNKTFKNLLTQKNINKLNKLCAILSKICNKSVTLDLIPLSVPFFDDNILVKSLGILSKKVSVVNIINLVFGNIILYSKNEASYVYNYSITKSFLSGAKIKIGGRLMTQKVIPRISSRIIQRGSISPNKVTYSNWSRLNLKNKRGSHSLTVILSHMM